MKVHAAEQTHWYDREGNPRYTVPYADPKKGFRNTTLRDAKKLNLVPSVTTILAVPNKPGLNRWKENQILMSALTLPQIAGETLDSFSLRVMEDSKKHAKEAAERGTAIHKSLEQYFQGESPHPDHAFMCSCVMQSLSDKYGALRWTAEKSFSSPLGFGGKVDLHCHAIIADFKTKEFDEDNLPKAFPEQSMQLSAYANGLGYPNAKLVNVFVSVSNPGLVHIVEHEEGNHFEKFKHLLEYWKLEKGYDSGF